MTHLIRGENGGTATGNQVSESQGTRLSIVSFYLSWFWESSIEVVFMGPLRNLYLKGYWQSMPNMDICVQLAGSRAMHWAAQELECSSIIDKRFMSYIWIVMVLGYFYMCYEGLRFLFFYFFYVRPFQAARSQCRCGREHHPRTPRYLRDTGCSSN